MPELNASALLSRITAVTSYFSSAKSILTPANATNLKRAAEPTYTLELEQDSTLTLLMKDVLGDDPDDRTLITALLLELILREQGQTALRSKVAELAYQIDTRDSLATKRRDIIKTFSQCDQGDSEIAETMLSERRLRKIDAQVYHKLTAKLEVDLKESRKMVKKLAKQFGKEFGVFLAMEI